MANTYFDTAKITGSVSSLVPVIDDFEDQDFSEYVGDTGSASVVSSPVANGSYAGAVSAGENEIRSTSGLDNYPSQGDVWRFYTYIPTDGKPRFYWGVQDSSNYYYLEFDDQNSTLRFVKVDAGSSTTLDTASITFDTGAYSETEVEWRTNGRHLIEYFDSTDTSQATIDATDTTYSSGGVGWGEWSTGVVAKTSLVSWYKLDAGSGSTATDYEGNNDGTINGASWTTTSKTGGYALDFDGSDDYVNLNNDTLLDGLSEFSVTYWVNMDDKTINNFVSSAEFSGSNSGFETQYLDSDDAFRWYHYDSGGATTDVRGTTSPNTGQWYHIAVTNGSSDTTLYVDANSEATGTARPMHNTTDRATELGTNVDDSYPANATLDDVRFYDKKLSASEIQSIYDNTK